MTGRILVVDDVATNRIILKAKLSTAYYTVLLAASGPEALKVAQEDEPDIILLDVMMPDMDGYEVCQRIKSDPRLSHIPVVMVTALNSAEERIRGLEVGADDFLTKPLRDLALFSRVRNLMRMKLMFDELRMRDLTTRDLGLVSPVSDADLFATAHGHVLFVADPAAEAEGWASNIGAKLDIRTSACTDGRIAMDLVLRDPPDAIVVSQIIGAGEDALRLVSALRSTPQTRQAAIIFAVQGEDIELAAKALDLGASDYILSPFDAAELVARLRSQIKRKLVSDRLRNNVRDGLMMAMVDPLTGLFNRRYATRHLASILERARETGRSFGTMMLDLDRFKSVNDRYGHQAGDEVLKEFARRLVGNVRSEDLVARLGGEEFFVAMPDVDASVAAMVAERVRASVADPAFLISDGKVELSITVSIGVSIARPGESDAVTLIRRADEALYQSKNGGRNKVTLAEAA